MTDPDDVLSNVPSNVLSDVLSDVSSEYDESGWTWPDWEPTPLLESLIDRLCLFLFGGRRTSDDGPSP